ncbi:hypothetical protein GCM10010501_06740 [Streptomyces libani subsp. rufus]|nr:hypothetical protein GCM10010501_06740 [Streptomyces libani subsp. rufus]
MHEKGAAGVLEVPADEHGDEDEQGGGGRGTEIGAQAGVPVTEGGLGHTGTLGR